MSNSSALAPVQQAIFTRLTGDTALMAVITGVHDTVPEPSLYPYVVIGESIETPDNQLGQFGSRISATLHIWSRYRGMAETNTIINHVVRILDHAPVAIGGRTLIAVRLEQILTLRDTDPDLRHGVVRFTVETY